MQRPRRVGQVGGALALEVGHEHETAGSGGACEREAGEGVVVDVQQAGGRVEHPGAR